MKELCDFERVELFGHLRNIIKPLCWENWQGWYIPKPKVEEMLAAQFGHCFPGQVIQVSGSFIIHCDRQDHAICNSTQILSQADTFLFCSVGIKPEMMENTHKHLLQWSPHLYIVRSKYCKESIFAFFCIFQCITLLKKHLSSRVC